MTDDGLVGKIVKFTGRYAICQNLFDPNARVSVRIQRNRELGVTSWFTLGATIPLMKSRVEGDIALMPTAADDVGVNPAFLRLPTGHLLAFYSAHGGPEMYLRSSLAPDDIAAWTPERSLRIIECTTS